MSSGNLDEIYHETNEDSYDSINELNIDFSKIVIPFSKVFNSYKSVDIYSGMERILFKDRDPEYKMILRQEFANYIKVEHC